MDIKEQVYTMKKGCYDRWTLPLWWSGYCESCYIM